MAENSDGVRRTTGVGSVTGDIGTVVSGTTGSVNVFSIGLGTAHGRRRDPLPLDVEHADTLRAVFVEPHGWDDARRVLGTRRHVFLSGGPGTGRATAAWRLLLDMAGDPRAPAIHELDPLPDEPGERTLDPDDVEEGGCYRLDLSGLDDGAFRAVQRELAGFVRTVVERRAALVALLPADVDHATTPEIQTRVVELDAPDGLAVLHGHLLWYGIAAPDPMPVRVADEVRVAAPARIALLARLTSRARDDHPSADAGAWLEQARTATFDRGREIAAETAELPAGTRALLLSASLFEGASDEIVLDATRQLLQSIEHTDEPRPDFEAAGLGTRLAEVGGRVRPDGRVEVDGLDRSAAVREFFWTQYPALRDGFRRWVLRCVPAAARVDADTVDEVVARFTEECLRVRRHEDVAIAVGEWATGRSTERLAGVALGVGLRDPRQGRFLRRHCYDWATSAASVPGTHPRLADLVVEACRDVIAETHPAQAIVRLRHLCAANDESVAAHARAALSDVVDRHPHHLDVLLRRIPSSTRRETDARTFLAVVGSARLLDGAELATSWTEPVLRTRLVAGWREALAVVPTAERDRPLHTWFTSAAASPVLADTLLPVLVGAAIGRGTHLRALERSARAWSAARRHDDSDRLVTRLVAELDAAVVQAVVAETTAIARPPDPRGEHHDVSG